MMSSENDPSFFSSDENHKSLEMIKDHVMQVVLANEWLHGSQQVHQLEWLRENKEKTSTILEFCLSDIQYSEYSLQLGAAIWRFWLREGDYEKGHDKLTQILAHGVGKNASLGRAFCLEGQGALAKQLGWANKAEACYLEMNEIGRSLNQQDINAWAGLGLGDIQFRSGNLNSAYTLLSNSCHIFEELKDARGIIKAQKGMGIVELKRNHYKEATELLQMSLDLARKTSNDHLTADCLNDLGTVANAQGFYGAAREFYEESLSIVEDLKDQSRQSILLNNLSVLCIQLLDFRKGLNYALKAAELYQDLGEPLHQAYALMNAAESEMELESYSAARKTLFESLQVMPDKGDWYGIINILETAGFIANRTHKLKDAATFFGMAEALRSYVKSEAHPTQEEKLERNYQITREGLGDETFDRVWEEGYLLSTDEIVRRTENMLFS